MASSKTMPEDFHVRGIGSEAEVYRRMLGDTPFAKLIRVPLAPEEVALLQDILDMDAVCQVLEPEDQSVMNSLKEKLSQVHVLRRLRDAGNVW